MRFCCYGVRGSRPVPLTRREIISIASRICSTVGKDNISKYGEDPDKLYELVSEKLSKEDIHGIFGVGGNTPSIELITTENPHSHIIFDLGTGASKLALQPSSREFHVFFTHFHYDHVQGLPFAPWLYLKDAHIHFYSPVKGFKDILYNLMKHPYFPITMNDIIGSKIHFHELDKRDSVNIDNVSITWKAIEHPGGSYAYKVSDGKKTFCYFSDVSIQGDLFLDNESNNFMKDVDSMVLDSSMGFINSITKANWGHTSLFKGLSFCKLWNIKKVYLFHFDPSDNICDTSLNYQTALWYNKAIQSNTKVFFAQEDDIVSV